MRTEHFRVQRAQEQSGAREYKGQRAGDIHLPLQEFLGFWLVLLHVVARADVHQHLVRFNNFPRHIQRLRQGHLFREAREDKTEEVNPGKIFLQITE